jgi:hypothetical protein
MVIRQIGVGSLAKILAALYAFWGFIFGAILALAAMVGAGIGAGNDNAMPVWFGGIFGAGAIIILPILYGCFGALGGALTAVMYNVVAGMVGGLLVETE